MQSAEKAVIVGAGQGLSAALARRFARDGMTVALVARDAAKLAGLAKEVGGLPIACDASDPAEVGRLFATLDDLLGAPELVVYNASLRTRGPLTDLDPAAVEKALLVSCYGGFLVGQAAARRMLPRGSGTILFTGASASVRGYAQSAPFAMGKFGLRGLAQSMARELHPNGIHVAHIVIDGAIGQAGAGNGARLDPQAIAETYLHLHRQPRSAWTDKLALRPWAEPF